MSADKKVDEMFCRSCGEAIKIEAEICPKCGVRQKAAASSSVSNKWLTTVLLCFFLGGLGVHRFYVGKTGTGVLMLLTGGLCGILWLIDFIVIVMGNFTDSNGNVISNNN